LKTLLVAATRNEITNFLPENGYSNPHLDILITGMGMVPAATRLSRAIASGQYSQVLHAGISGSFRSSLPPGTIVYVATEYMADLGFDNMGKFVSAFRTNFIPPDEPPFRNGWLINPAPAKNHSLPVVRGVTSDTITGSLDRIDRIMGLCDPDVESMEGAAVFYVCMDAGIPFHSFRSISNFVGPRDKANWQIPLAIEHLNRFLAEIIK
jgi:futalosine hydrolase